MHLQPSAPKALAYTCGTGEEVADTLDRKAVRQAFEDRDQHPLRSDVLDHAGIVRTQPDAARPKSPSRCALLPAGSRGVAFGTELLQSGAGVFGTPKPLCSAKG